jgi:hypothetical protein
MTTPPRWRSRRQALAPLAATLGAVARPNPLVWAWRWRYELILATAMSYGAIKLARILGAGWALGLIAALIAVAALWPPARHRLAARAWCVITPHRVRTGCAEAFIHSRQGRLPAVLLTTRQPFGERVSLWCRPGTSAQDFVSARSVLIAACWAQDIRVTCSPRHAHLVTLDVIRRPASTRPDGPAASERPGESAAQVGPLRPGNEDLQQAATELRSYRDAPPRPLQPDPFE